MRGNWVSLRVPTVLAAVLVAASAASVGGSVVSCESELRLAHATSLEREMLLESRPGNRMPHSGSSARLETELSEIFGHRWLGLARGMGGKPLRPPHKQRERDRQRSLIEAVSNNPADMAPTSNSLLSQGNGSGGGSALPSKLLSAPEVSLQGSLPPEAKTALPTGPPFRFFRPPRVVLK